jgi:ComEC/Rec2-related protein
MLPISPYFIKISPPPTLWYAASCIVGVVLSHYEYSFFYILCFGLPALLFLPKKQTQLGAVIALSICIMATGFIRYYYLKKQYTATLSALHAVTSGSFRATVIHRETEKKRSPRTELTLLLHLVKKGRKSGALNSCVKLTILHSCSVEVGDRIRIKKLTFKPIKNSSYQWYLFKEGLAGSAFIKRLNYTLEHRPVWSIHRWVFTQRERIIKHCNLTLSGETFSLLSALFFGKQPHGLSFYGSVRSHFTYWGVVHFLARSGLHLVLLAFCWSYLMRKMVLPFLLKQFLLGIFMYLYHLLTWPSISFMRALITFFIYRSATLSKQTVQPLHVLALTSLFVLLHNPVQLFFLDFQLSFGLTFALAWFNEVSLRKSRIPHAN